MAELKLGVADHAVHAAREVQELQKVGHSNTTMKYSKIPQNASFIPTPVPELQSILIVSELLV